MPGWHRLDPREFGLLGRTENRSGVEITMLISPYDFPNAVRGEFDSAGGCLRIEFRYIQTEDCETRDLDEYVRIRVGKNSGRIYGIEVDVARLKAGQVTLSLGRVVTGALSDLADRPKRRVKEDNLSFARKVLESHPDLFEARSEAVGVGLN